MVQMRKITDILTDEEIKKVVKLYAEAPAGSFATRCCEEIIKPVLPRINERLGQQNDPKYLAYMVEYVLTKAGHV